MPTKTAPQARPRFIQTFSLGEKTLMRLGLYGFIAVGFAGIHAADPAWGWGYLAFAGFGFMGPVAGYLCARCPYPYVQRTCLFVPHGVITWIYAQRRGPMTAGQKAAMILFFAALVAAPLPWLVAQPVVFAAFLALAVPTYATVLVRYCRRCRNVRCPFNRVHRAAG